MKDYINKLARGEFDYITPKLIDLVDEIECDVVENKVSHMVMTLNATSSVKGIIYSSDRRVKIVNNTYYGKHLEIEYTVDTLKMKPGEIITGTFTYVTSAGEAETTYKFTVSESSVKVSGEEIFNMFHFTELFKTSPEAAVKLFKSEKFIECFLHDDANLVNLYNVFSNERNVRLAIEEFLIAVKKKSTMAFSIDCEEKEYENCIEDIGENIKITADCWGYARLNIATDCKFIKLDKTELTTDEFTANQYELRYVIEQDKLSAGINYGRVVIKTNNQTMQLVIKVRNSATVSIEDKATRRASYNLTREYLNFRTGISDRGQWTDNSIEIIEEAGKKGVKSLTFEIAYAQMLITKRKIEEGLAVLDNVSERVEETKEENIIRYCYYQYVKSLAVKDVKYTESTADTISEYISAGNDDWKLLWLSFYTDKNSDKNKSIKLARIKEAFHNGCNSPIMFFEACVIFNESPHLLRVLNGFELQVIYFGCRYDLLNKELAFQVCDIVDGMKSADITFLRMLNLLYKKMEDDKILSVLTKQMIRNDITGKNASVIYEKSILRGLRITSLYEYYMASIELDCKTRIPKMVLLYFVYESTMSYKLKAFLYEYVIENNNLFPDIYGAYIKNIETFAFEQLKLVNIDDNLAKIYKSVIVPEMVTKENAENIIELLFTYKVTCFDREASYIIVKHKELNFEDKYPIFNGTAYIRIFSDNAAVVFEYQDGSRRMDSVVYEIEKMFDSPEILEEAIKLADENIYTAIGLNEANIHKTIASDNDLAMNQSILKSDKISEGYRKIVNSRLIAYYHENYSGEGFNQIYKGLIKTGLDSDISSRLIETCISNEMYDEAFNLANQYGFDKVKPDKICMLARFMILLDKDNQDELLMDMCRYAFDNKKYDEVILAHLVRYFNEGTDEMYAVWKACLNFNENNMELTERLIAQMLFTQNHSGRLTEVFTYYYNSGVRNTVVEAYLSYNAYLYFVKQRKANNIVFTVIENKLMDDYKASDVCKLSLLKHYSEQNVSELSDVKKKIAQKIMDEMSDNDIVFSFYKKFNGVLNIPYSILDKNIVEYRGNPESKVVIHFILSDNKTTDKYSTEPMKSKIFGIYTASFTLFYGDTLEYYISENYKDTKIDSEKHTIMCNEINPDETKGRFDYLNDIFASKKLHDGATMKKLMHGYSVLEYVSKEIFGPLE